MSKVFIEETSLTAIGDAIREKTGTTDLMSPAQMATAITGITTGGGGAEVEPLQLTGICKYGCAGAVSAKYVELFGNDITTYNLTNTDGMFSYYSGTSIPFELNYTHTSYVQNNMLNMFQYSNITTPPVMNNVYPASLEGLFSNAQELVSIPEDFISNWDFSYMQTNNYATNNSIFKFCYKLRTIPGNLLKVLGYTKGTSKTYSPYNMLFYSCRSLDEAKGIGVCADAKYTSNVFSSTFYECHRLSKITFETNEYLEPIAATWSKQTIDLTGVGYGTTSGLIGAGFTTDKQVTSLDTYNALKNDADWWTTDVNFSRYNVLSASGTINSLPDCSTGSTNTIKFKGTAGSGYSKAISTLDETTIAKATAKGWTVTIS